MTLRTLLLSFVLAIVLAATLSASDADSTKSDVKTPGASAGSQVATSEDRTPNGPIQDNSFLVEEAYNQEDGVIQHISFFERLANSKSWTYAFTDEWPLRTQKHQLSATFDAVHSGDFGRSGAGIGDTAINYRYQLVGTGETKLAIAPRISLLLASGDSTVGRGYGGNGVQTNIPVSIIHNRRLVTHWNAGATWVPRAKNEFGEKAGVVAVNLGQSFIWQFSNRINGMLETVWTSSEAVVGSGKTVRSQDIFMSPGVRCAFNFKNGLQIVPGIGVPVGVGPSVGQKGVIGYLSFEHPFAWSHSR